MTKVYLAASYGRRDEVRRYGYRLERLGYTITSRWLTDDHNIPSAIEVESAQDSIPLVGSEFAGKDIEDVKASDILVMFSESPMSGVSRGGRHVEFGMAMAWEKKIIVIGPRENIFHTLSPNQYKPGIKHYAEWRDAWLYAFSPQRNGQTDGP